MPLSTITYTCINGVIKIHVTDCCKSLDHGVYHSCGRNDFTDAFDNDIKHFKDNEVKYLILIENPLLYKTYVYNPNGTGGYINEINNAFEITNKKGANRLKEWQEKGVLVVDIYNLFVPNLSKEGLACKDACKDCKDDNCKGIKDCNDCKECRGAPITSELRGVLQKPIHGLVYPVYRLQVTFKMLDSIGISISECYKLALSMPEKTSFSLFNHYGLNGTDTLSIRTKDFAPFFRELNILSYYPRFPYTIIPRHKINTMGASNQVPDANLLKIALGL